MAEYKWDCDRCGGEKTLTSSHSYFNEGDYDNKAVPAGVCECSKCGMKGLACPSAKGVPGIPGVEGHL